MPDRADEGELLMFCKKQMEHFNLGKAEHSIFPQCHNPPPHQATNRTFNPGTFVNCLSPVRNVTGTFRDKAEAA